MYFRLISTFQRAKRTQTDTLEYDDLPVQCSNQTRVIVAGLASTEDGQKWLNYSLSFKQMFVFDETGAKFGILLDLSRFRRCFTTHSCFFRAQRHLTATQVEKLGNDASDRQISLQRVFGAANDNEAFFKKWADLTGE